MKKFMMIPVLLVLSTAANAAVLRTDSQSVVRATARSSAESIYRKPNSALDSLAEEFRGLLVEELDVFFEKWSEISSSITSSRQLCELD